MRSEPVGEDSFLATAMRDAPLISEIALEVFKGTIPGGAEEADSQVTALYASSSAMCIIEALYLIDQAKGR